MLRRSNLKDVTPVIMPVLPDYQGGCLSNLVPELIKNLLGRETAAWLPAPVKGAKQVVLLVLDGLGWEQLRERSAMAPTLAAFEGGSITSVTPTTTATCLTSIVTGKPPSSHGVLGYRMSVGDEILNVLKWSTSKGDAIEEINPETFQTHPAFAANQVPVVTRKHFAGTGFARAHIHGAKYHGYSVLSSMPLEIWKLAKQGEPFIYAYYDGIDTVAHDKGFGEYYDAELYSVDRLIRDILAGLPEGATLVVTSDHGQVEVGENIVPIDPEIVARCKKFSGEGRFRWLHVDQSEVDAVADLARERHGDRAWVMTKKEMSEYGWYGGPLNELHSCRIGDVALVAFDPIAFNDPTHNGESEMKCRHGSLTSAEMLVPLVAKRV